MSTNYRSDLKGNLNGSFYNERDQEIQDYLREQEVNSRIDAMKGYTIENDLPLTPEEYQQMVLDYVKTHRNNR